MRTCPPLAASVMADRRGPSISAAGACSHKRTAPTQTERKMSPLHCDIGANPLNRPGDEFSGSETGLTAMDYCTNSSASPFIFFRVSINSADADASRASSVPRSTSETLTLPLRKPG